MSRLGPRAARYSVVKLPPLPTKALEALTMSKLTRPAPVSKRNMSMSVLRSMTPKLLKLTPLRAVALEKLLPWSSAA